jgi:hypothetical protein
MLRFSRYHGRLKRSKFAQARDGVKEAPGSVHEVVTCSAFHAPDNVLVQEVLAHNPGGPTHGIDEKLTPSHPPIGRVRSDRALAILVWQPEGTGASEQNYEAMLLLLRRLPTHQLGFVQVIVLVVFCPLQGQLEGEAILGDLIHPHSRLDFNGS